MNPKSPSQVWLMVVVPLIAAAGLVKGEKLYPLFNESDVAKSMKVLQQDFAAAESSVIGGDTGAAKIQLIRSRETLATTITYWRNNNNDGALALLRKELAIMDDLDTELSADSVDKSKAVHLAGEIRETCEACHGAYRGTPPKR